MGHSSEHFQDLMQQVKEGSDDAVQELLEMCNGPVYRIVRHNLSRKLRSQFDSTDFVQAMWASFFENMGAISEFERPENLIAFLARVASNKVIDEGRRRLKSQKRNVELQVSRDDPLTEPVHAMVANDPSASQVAIANEEWSRLIKGQSPRDQEILELRAAGKRTAEIAQKLGLHESTIRRVIQKLINKQQALS